MKTAIHLGLFSEYDEMTPYELNLCVEAFNESREVKSREQVTLVWLGEYYHRTKKLKGLNACLNDFFGGDQVTMSDEQMLEKVKELHMKFEKMFS